MIRSRTLQMLIKGIFLFHFLILPQVAAQEDIKTVKVDPISFPEISLHMASRLPGSSKPTQGDFTIREDGVIAPIIRYESQLGSNVIDVAVAFDVSGSMADKVEALKTTSTYLAESLERTKSNCRLALVTFCSQVKEVYDFTDKISEFKKWISNLQAMGYCDEVSMEGVIRCLNMIFREEAEKRVVVLITDEPPSDPDRMQHALESLTKTKAILYAIAPDMPVFRRLTDSSGGALFDVFAGNPNKLIEQVIDLIIGNFLLVYNSPKPDKDGTRRTVKVSMSTPEASGQTTAEYVAPQESEKPPHLVWDSGQKDEFGQDEDVRYSGRIELTGWSGEHVQSFANGLNFVILAPSGQSYSSMDSPTSFIIEKEQQQEAIRFVVNFQENKGQGGPYHFLVKHLVEELGQYQFTVAEPLFTYSLYRTHEGREEKIFVSTDGSSTISEPLFPNDVIHLIIQPTLRYLTLSGGLGSPPQVTVESGIELQKVDLTPQGGDRWLSNPISLDKTGSYRISVTATVPGGTRTSFKLDFEVGTLEFGLKWSSTPQEPIYQGQRIGPIHGAVEFQTGNPTAFQFNYQLVSELWQDSNKKPMNLTQSSSDGAVTFEIPVPTDVTGSFRLVVKVLRTDTKEATQSRDFDFEVLPNPIHLLGFSGNETGRLLVDSRKQSKEIRIRRSTPILLKATCDSREFQIRNSRAAITDADGKDLKSVPLFWREEKTHEGKIESPNKNGDYFITVVTELEPSPQFTTGRRPFQSEFRYSLSVAPPIPRFILLLSALLLIMVFGAYTGYKYYTVKDLPRLAGKVIFSGKGPIDITSKAKGYFKRNVRIGFGNKYDIPITSSQADKFAGAGFELGYRRDRKTKNGFQLYLRGIRDSNNFHWQSGVRGGRLGDGVPTDIRAAVIGDTIDVTIGPTTMNIVVKKPEKRIVTPSTGEKNGSKY